MSALGWSWQAGARACKRYSSAYLSDEAPARKGEPRQFGAGVIVPCDLARGHAGTPVTIEVDVGRDYCMMCVSPATEAAGA